MPRPKKPELSVIQLGPDLTAHVDIWAAANAVERSVAIQRLVEIGLKTEAGIARIPRHCRDDLAIEARAANYLDRLIDPDTPQEERDRRIHRLTDGPPEFVELRLDLPGRRPH